VTLANWDMPNNKCLSINMCGFIFHKYLRKMNSFHRAAFVFSVHLFARIIGLARHLFRPSVFYMLSVTPLPPPPLPPPPQFYMLSVTPLPPPPQQYPVARQALSGAVWVFENQNSAVCLQPKGSGWKFGETHSHFDLFDGGWTPIDLHITD
jgi:hypothetical protein